MTYSYIPRPRAWNRVGRYIAPALLALTAACEDQAAPLAPQSIGASAARVPSPGPDAGKILFSANLSGNPIAPRKLHSIRPDGTELTQVPTVVDEHHDLPVWSPDFRMIAFASTDDHFGEPSYSVHVVDADGTPRAEFGFGMRPRWSPDGRKVLFTRHVGNNSELFLGSLKGNGRVTQLTFSPESEGDATWSSDGSRIAFVRYTGEQSEIYVMDADGRGPALKITNCAQESARCSLPSWSVLPGDERILVFVGKSIPELRLIRADEGPATTLLTDALLAEESPSWSPDGSAVAFVSRRDALDPATQSDLYTIDVATKAVTRVTSIGSLGHTVSSPGWSR